MIVDTWAALARFSRCFFKRPALRVTRRRALPAPPLLLSSPPTTMPTIARPVFSLSHRPPSAAPSFGRGARVKPATFYTPNPVVVSATRGRSTSDGNGGETQRRSVGGRRDVRVAATGHQSFGLFNLEDIAKPFISVKETLNEGGARARAATPAKKLFCALV